MGGGVCIFCKSERGRQVVYHHFFVCYSCADKVTEIKSEDEKPPLKQRPKSEGLIDLREFMDMRWGVWPGQEGMIPRFTKIR